MKIAVIVHGRFFAFDLVRSLLQRGHEIGLFTNYPVWAAKRFGVPPECIHSFWPHGVLCRALDRFDSVEMVDAALHRAFGKWAANQLSRSQWDVVQAFSGVAEEPLEAAASALRLLVRGSAHIRTQDQILEEESTRTGARLDRPTAWKIAREEREYGLCDRILVLSRFAYDSFIGRGVPPERLAMLPLAADTLAFRPSDETLRRRRERILSGQPLTVLFTGNVSFQKGLYDFAEIARALQGRFRFRMIGTITREAREFAAAHLTSVELVPHQPEAELPKWYADGDLFLFPTLQDGYAVVLAQAQASSLPLLTSSACAGPELVVEDQTGWVRPVRAVDAFIERLLWCDRNRVALARMVERIHTEFRVRGWDDVAADFEDICLNARHPHTLNAGIEAH